MGTGPPLQGYNDWQPRSVPQNQDDLLLSNTDLPNGSPQIFNVTLQNRYVGIVIVIESPNFQNDIQVNVQNTGVLNAQYSQTQILGVGVPGSYYFPMVNFIGDTIKVVIDFTASLLGGSIFIFGARSMPGIQVRPDGRLYSTNSLIAAASQVGIGNGDVVFAPAAPARILVGAVNLCCVSSAGGAIGVVAATVEGTTINLIAISGAAAQYGAQNWPSGVLCDPGTPVLVEVGTAAATIIANVQYDIVV